MFISLKKVPTCLEVSNLISAEGIENETRTACGASFLRSPCPKNAMFDDTTGDLSALC